MNDTHRALEASLRLLEQLGARFALVGGLAVSARTEPRFTRDVDLAVAARSDHEAEQLVAAILARGYGMLAQIEHEVSGRLATVRLQPSGDASVVVDLLFASSGIEPEIVQQAEPIALLEGLVVPVARIEHLIALKVLSYDAVKRPIDRVDFLNLIAEANASEIDDARAALALITARGYHRDTDLDGKFASMRGSES